MGLLDDFARSRPADASRPGGEWFIAAEALPALLAEVQRAGARLLGLEGFLIGDDGIYPALSRIADFSDDSPEAALAKAHALLDGAWRLPPTPADQMHAEATGRHMLAVVIDES